MSGRLTYFRWGEDEDYRLAYLVHKYKAYKKTDETKKDKWNAVLNAVLAEPIFSKLKETEPNWQAIQRRFERMSGEMLKALGVSEEGANLSGLDVEASPLQTLIVNMAEEVYKLKMNKKKKKEEKKAVQKALLTHERTGLTAQGAVREKAGTTSLLSSPAATANSTPAPQKTTSALDAVDTSDSEDEGAAAVVHNKKEEEKKSPPDSSAKPKKKSALIDEFTAQIVNLLEESEDDEEDKELDRLAKRQKLQHEQDEHELRMEERRATLKMHQAILQLVDEVRKK